jgi:biotin carboxyl carrier protein
MVQQTTAIAAAAPGELIEELLSFDGPPDQFLYRMLMTQCRVGGAEAGAILRLSSDGDPQAVAVHPPIASGEETPAWLGQAAEASGEVVSLGRSQILPLRSPDELYGMEPARHLLLMPVKGRSSSRGVEAFVIPQTSRVLVDQARQRLELTHTLLSLYEMRLTVQQYRFDLQRLVQTIEVLNELNRHDHFKSAAMALCNHLAATFEADRVSAGLVAGRYVKLLAISHTNQFNRKTELVQAIESAMEEAVDQDIEVVHPAGPEATMITRAAGELAARAGHVAVVTLPLRRGGKVVGAITMERTLDKPLTVEQLETLRLGCEMITPRLLELEDRDVWLGQRLVRRTRKLLASLVGPQHTWAKVAAIATLGLILFAVFVPGPYRVSAPFLVEATQRQTIAAPFDSYLIQAPVRPGDSVVAGQTILAQLDTSELRHQLAEAVAQRSSYLTQAESARRESKIADAQIAEAEAQSLAARIALLQWRIEQAAIRSPITGIVISGDLSRQLGVKLSAGQKLFEVAPLESLRAKIAVPEARVADLLAGQTGQLAALATPGNYLPFELERIDPMAQVVDNRNIFHAHARLTDAQAAAALRPGMEGVARIDIDRRSYGWIWLHEVIDWVRMKLWI